MGCKRKKAKTASRNKGKKMRDSNVKEGSDVETLAEDCTPAAAATPATAPGPQAAEEDPALPSAAAAAAEPEESAATAEPAPAQEAAPLAEDTSVPTATPTPAPAPTPTPTPAPAPALPSLSIGRNVNMFNPDFLQSPTTTPIIPMKSAAASKKVVSKDGEKEDSEKEEKMVAARNEENNKVSAGLKSDTSKAVRTYSADQWSPNNPEGKKKYDRLFLMELRQDPQSLKKPDGLPDMDVVLKENDRRAIGNEFAPGGFMRPAPRQPVGKRRSQQSKPSGGKPAMVHLSISLRENVKLHETENAWKPHAMVSGKDANEDELATKELNRRVRGVLNKLTPSNFEKLVSQVQDLHIDTIERLKGVINLVFDKAVDEPSFSVAYAKMCNELKSKEVTESAASIEAKGLSFQKILIIRCQQEFEKNKAAELNKDQKLKEIEAETDLDKKKEMQLLFEDEERRERMKSVGTIRFIGELYKLGMLTGQIMHRCIDQLLSKHEEESLECLCKLLSTIGRKLETEYQKGHDILNEYFVRMKELTDKKGKGKKISSRVRFMLQDVIDLRACNWVPRRDDTNPKTMDQIQKEAERDLMDSHLAPANSGRKDDRMGRGGAGMDKRGGRGPQTSDDGWKMASPRNRPVDMSKLKTSKIDSDTLGSSHQFSKWGGGSSAKESTQPKKNQTLNIALTNTFSALDRASPLSNSMERLKPMMPAIVSKERSSAGERRSSSRSNSQQGRSSQPPSRDSSSVRGERDDERRNRVPTPSTLASRQVNDQVSDDKSDTLETGPVCQGKRLEAADDIQRSAETLMNELRGHENIEEATLGLREHCDWINITEFAQYCMLFVCDWTNGLQLVGNFFVNLHKENLILNRHIVKALSEVIGEGPDLVLDVPKVWTHIATLVATLLIGDVITFSDFAKMSTVLKGTSCSEQLLNNTIQILLKEKTPSWVQSHWESSGVSWTDFLEEKDVEDFINKNQLGSFSSGALASKSEMTQQQIHEKLLEMLRPEAQSFDSIVEWIEVYVGNKASENFFIRALVTAICETSIKESSPGKYVLSEEKFKLHEKLLLRFITNKAPLELHCLFAVQALMNRLEHPQGIILGIFNLLWEDSVISSDAFLAWFNSKDPQEMEGKGVCATSLNSFLTMLTEVDDNDEDDS